MNALELVPGVRRMRPDDHFMVLTETDASPMHVGALLLLDVPDGARAGLTERLRTHLAKRLPATPLLARLVEAPDGFDSDVWTDLASADMQAHVIEEAGVDIGAGIARINLQRLDLARPPFMAHVFPAAGAVYFKMHHAVADGIGFQEVLRLLSDDASPVPPRAAAAKLPSPRAWRVLSEARFAAEEKARTAQSAARRAALAALEAFKGLRAETPVLKMSAPTSARRTYATISLPLAPFKAAANALGATVNDLFLACGGTALRAYLGEIDDLPEAPLVINSSRSYRRPEHGAFANRIVAIHPHLGTHIADPLERLRVIQSSMAAELKRTHHDEALLDALEKPYGARDRRAMFAQRTAGGGRVLPGNVTLSNVPGPAGERTVAGYRQLHNFPVPIIGSGRFLNITSRRSGGNLDMGVIADPEKIADVARVAALFAAAAERYSRLARAQQGDLS
jgi:diacylglycerol O-acyltransferase / wax synthase